MVRTVDAERPARRLASTSASTSEGRSRSRGSLPKLRRQVAAGDGRVQVDGGLLAVARRQRLRRPVLQPGADRGRRILDRGSGLDTMPALAELRPNLRLGS